MWFSLCLSVILLRSVSCVFTIKIGLDWLNISETVRDRGLLPLDHNRNGIWTIEWSHDRWRHVTLIGQTRDPNTLRAQSISRKRLDLETPFQRTTNRKWYIDYQMVTWSITSRDPRRCCEAVRSAILATAWLLISTRYMITLDSPSLCFERIIASPHLSRNSSSHSPTSLSPSIPRPFTPDLKLICLILSPHSLSVSGSIWTAFTDVALGSDFIGTDVCLF